MKEVIVVMRKNEVKKTLKTVEIKPDRIRKNEFLDQIYEPDLSIRSFVKSQFFFIKGYLWLLSGLLFLLLLIMIGNAKCQEQIWPVSAMMPFGILILTNEMNRSAKYRMHEFEMATLFSAKAALMARVLIIGLVQIGILLFTIPTACVRVDITFFQAAFYMLCPYCLSACLNLGVLCRMHGENAEYVCIAVSSMVSVLFVVLTNLSRMLLLADSGCFLLLSVIFMVIAAIEAKKYLNQMEELAWN